MSNVAENNIGFIENSRMDTILHGTFTLDAIPINIPVQLIYRINFPSFLSYNENFLQ